MGYTIFYNIFLGRGDKVKLINMVKRELEDMRITDKCHTCCLCCDKYKLVKEQNKKCEVRKARGRIIARQVRSARNIGWGDVNGRL